MKDYTGLKRNSLTALKHSNTVKKQTFWLFKCDCGNEKILRANKVFSINTTTKSCGCLRLKKINTDNFALNKVYKSYIKGAEFRKYSFDLDILMFKEITSLNCFYCGIEPSRISKTKTHTYLYNGIDRKDNNIGYNNNNCVPCCTLCNKAKRDLDESIFDSWLKRVSLFQIKKLAL